VIVAVALAVGSPLAVAGAQAYLTQGQVRLERLQQQLDAQVNQHRDLELRVAQLEQPATVLSEAEKQGLVSPTSVVDLPQVNQSSGQPPAPSGTSPANSSGGRPLVASPTSSGTTSGGR